MLKFAVVWHKDRDYGSPRHVMGMSNLFSTWEKAKKRLDDMIAEAKAHCDDKGDWRSEVPMVGLQNLWITSGDGWITYYNIQQITVDDTAGEEFEVQVTFSQMAVVKVWARTAEDAEGIVNSRIDNRTLSLTIEQRQGILNTLLENVESVKVLRKVEKKGGEART